MKKILKFLVDIITLPVTIKKELEYSNQAFVDLITHIKHMSEHIVQQQTLIEELLYTFQHELLNYDESEEGLDSFDLRQWDRNKPIKKEDMN